MTSFFSNRHILVTGATGIVGSWLTDSLIADGATVVCLIRDWDPQSNLIRSGAVQQTTVVHGCLEDINSIERAIVENDVDIVFHLGAQTIVGTAYKSPLLTFESNIRGTYNLLEACRIHQDTIKSVIIASSDKAYGESKDLPYLESHPLAGVYPYEVSKSCADLLAQSYWHTYRTPISIARCGNIFGGGDLNWTRLVPGTIRSALMGTPPIIRSDGQSTRDYMFVDDVVDAYKLLAIHMYKTPSIVGDHFNFSPERPLSVMDVVKEISTQMDFNKNPVILNQSEGEISHQSLNSGKAKRLLEWTPKYSFADGISKTIEWYRRFFSEKYRK